MSVAPSTVASALTPKASRALGDALNDVPTVSAHRTQAAEALNKSAMPSPSHDRPWKYVDPAALELDGFVPSLGTNPSTDNPTTIEGLSVTPFEEAGREGALGRLGKAVAVNSNRISALHYAFLQNGLLVETKPNTEVPEPVRLTREFNTAGALVTPHTLIVAGDNSRLSIIEEYRSCDEPLAALPVVELLVGPGAVVHYTSLHHWGTKTRVFSEQRAITERDSAVRSLSLVTGGLLVKSHIASSLEGRGSSSELYGLSVGASDEHIDFYTLQDHIAEDTRSDLLFKSALGDRSRAVYYGVTKVGLEGRRSDANQENRNLLLSRSAKADSDPVLEILTNDVARVSHGATAGPVDEEELFYIQSRGLTREGAVELLVRGFLGEPLDRSALVESVRQELNAVIEAKLQALGAEA
ncbi:MAG: hypothetical protein CL897_03835 [Dehalococcoidia bacterium]|nr:hypothetical protein [Dehalococcoidia bacterium]